MRYAIIGGAGFIGSHITDAVIARGHEAVVIDNLVSGFRKYIPKEAIFEWGDIRHSDDLERIFRKYSFDRCINLAAQPFIPKSYDHPKLFFETNANGALNVLEVCEKWGVPRILHFSTSEVYGTKDAPISEESPVRPQSTYAVSKLAADYLCQVRAVERKTPVIILRQFNCYGPRESHDYVIPEIIAQLSRGDTLYLGNIQSERDFTYAADAAEQAIELLEKGKCGEVYNAGSGNCVRIAQLVHLIAEIWGVEAKIVIDPAKFRPWDVTRLQSDNTKLYRTIDYRPKTTLRDGLQATIEWFKNNGNQWDF